MKRVLVDMSATLIHHGHIRIIKNAATIGSVIVALATDDEIRLHKGYYPELNYENRKEIIESIKNVSEVIASPWLIDNNFLIIHKIDFLIHGSDNINPVSSDKIIIFPRTTDISSTIIRHRCMSILNTIMIQND